MKFKLVLTIFAFFFVFFLLTSITSLQTFASLQTFDQGNTTPDQGNPKPSNPNCNNPFHQDYNKPECIESRLGLSQIDTKTIFIPRDPNSLVIVVFRIILAALVTLTAFRLVILGFQFYGASDSPDKRNQLLSKITYSLGGLVIALSALGLTYLVQNIFFGKTFDDQIIKCADLPANASQELKNKCDKVIQNTSPTP